MFVCLNVFMHSCSSRPARQVEPTGASLRSQTKAHQVHLSSLWSNFYSFGIHFYRECSYSFFLISKLPLLPPKCDQLRKSYKNIHICLQSTFYNPVVGLSSFLSHCCAISIPYRVIKMVICLLGPFVSMLYSSQMISINVSLSNSKTISTLVVFSLVLQTKRSINMETSCFRLYFFQSITTTIVVPQLPVPVRFQRSHILQTSLDHCFCNNNTFLQSGNELPRMKGPSFISLHVIFNM